MDFKFLCQHCGQRLSATTELTDSEAPCPKCGTKLIIPRAPVVLEPPKAAVSSPINEPQIPKKVSKKPAVPVAIFVMLAVLLAVAVFAINRERHSLKQQNDSTARSLVKSENDNAALRRVIVGFVSQPLPRNIADDPAKERAMLKQQIAALEETLAAKNALLTGGKKAGDDVTAAEIDQMNKKLTDLKRQLEALNGQPASVREASSPGQGSPAIPN